MGVKWELVAKAGEYEKNGETKTRYHNCGVVIERADGSYTAKIESLPVHFDGWLNLWEPKPKDGDAQPTKRDSAPVEKAKAMAAKARKPNNDPDDDGALPF
jgi:hypothetical protein